MKKILYLDRSDDFVSLLNEALGSGFGVTLVRSFAEAQALVQSQSFDLILTEIFPEGADGYRLCAVVRNDETLRKIPVIFFSVEESIEKKVYAFSAGGDDFVPKNIHPIELKLRVEANIRRSQMLALKGDVLTKGIFRINVPQQKVFMNAGNHEKEIILTSLEFKLFHYFFTHEGHVLAREQILSAVWGEKVNVLDRTVDRHISALRKKLGEGEFIKTVSSAGYRFYSSFSDSQAA